MSGPLKIRHDKNADVLYLVLRAEPAACGIEDHGGIVWRYALDGDLIGVTIMDYRERWQGRSEQLVNEIAGRFHIPSRDIERALEAAFSSRSRRLPHFL